MNVSSEGVGIETEIDVGGGVKMLKVHVVYLFDHNLSYD